MGGEYLPRYARGEVEIARIELESTTSDVISIRTRPAGSRILYRVCDEYETEWKRFGFVLSFNQCNLDCGSDLEGLRDFTRVDSDIYPELGRHYDRVCEACYLAACEALASDREESIDSSQEPA